MKAKNILLAMASLFVVFACNKTPVEPVVPAQSVHFSEDNETAIYCSDASGKATLSVIRADASVKATIGITVNSATDGLVIPSEIVFDKDQTTVSFDITLPATAAAETTYSYDISLSGNLDEFSKTGAIRQSGTISIYKKMKFIQEITGGEMFYKFRYFEDEIWSLGDGKYLIPDWMGSGEAFYFTVDSKKTLKYGGAAYRFDNEDYVYEVAETTSGLTSMNYTYFYDDEEDKYLEFFPHGTSYGRSIGVLGMYLGNDGGYAEAYPKGSENSYFADLNPTWSGYCYVCYYRTAENNEWCESEAVANWTTYYYWAIIDEATTTTGTKYDTTPNEVLKLTPVANVKSGDTVNLEGTVMANCTRGFILSDGTTNILYYNTAYAQDYKIGQKLAIKAAVISSYGKAMEIAGGKGETITKVCSTTAKYPEATAMDAAKVDAYATDTADRFATYVTLTGDLTVSGNYYNLAVDGATAQGSVYYATDEIKAQMTTGKTYAITGYAIGQSSNKYCNIVVTGVEEKGASTETRTYKVSLYVAKKSLGTQTVTVKGKDWTMTNFGGSGHDLKITVDTTAKTITVDGTASNLYASGSGYYFYSGNSYWSLFGVADLGYAYLYASGSFDDTDPNTIYLNLYYNNAYEYMTFTLAN